MRLNVYVRCFKTTKNEKRYYLIVRRFGHRDEHIKLGPVSRKTAEQKRVTVYNELLTGTYQSGANSVLAPVFDDFGNKFFTEFVVGARKPKTVILYKDCFKKILGQFQGKRLNEIKRESIETYLCSLPVGNRYKNILLSFFNVLFEKAVEWGYLNESPSENIARFKERSVGMRDLTPLEFAQILKIAYPWVRSIIAVAVHTGMRKSELLNLKFADIDWNYQKIRVVGKDDKVRYISMSTDLFAELKFLQEYWPNQQYGSDRGDNLIRYLTRKEYQKQYVFCKSDGSPIKDCYRSLNKLYNKVGISRVGLHGLRKTFCSFLARGNVHPKLAQALMGHTDFSLTMNIYTSVQTDQLQGAVAMLPSFRDGGNYPQLAAASS